MHKPEYKIRPMNRSEVELCTQWASAEGWNPGKHDAQAFYAADQKGFWVGLLDDIFRGLFKTVPRFNLIYLRSIQVPVRWLSVMA